MFKLGCLIALITCSCTTAKFSYPMPNSKGACMQLFRDVLAIQEVRNTSSDKMNGWTERFNGGNLSARKYRKKHLKWQTDENILRNRATLIYDVGYSAGCFDKNKVW